MCVACVLKKEGIPIFEATEKLTLLREIEISVSNSTKQQRFDNEFSILRNRDLLALSQQVVLLEESSISSNPFYVKALLIVFKIKSKRRIRFYPLEKQGIPINEAFEKADDLKNTHVCGVVSNKAFQDWIATLQKETLESLVLRIIGLEPSRLGTHPAYIKALLEVFSSKTED